MKTKKQLYYEKNKEKILARVKAWYQANKEYKRQYDVQYNNQNRDRKNEQSRNWVAKNPERRKDLRTADYYKHKGRAFANAAARRARILNAKPKWLTLEQHREIRTIYENRPQGYHVDHIIPLKGKIVCGLHVPWNLQYLPAEVNFSKGNKCA